MNAAPLAALHASAFDEAWSAAEIESLVEGGATAIADDDGFILIRVAADEAEILTLAVRPQARRRGLGRRLVARAFEAARVQGAAAIFLEVADDNDAAIGLYRSLGFAETGRRRNYYRRGPSRMQDALILSRALNRA